MARVILDTNNVLGATEALPTEIAGPTPQEFVEILRASKRYPDGFLLVCDGIPWEDAPKALPSGIQVKFSGHGVTADDVIAQVVSQSSISRQLLIITTDRALQQRVKRLKASTMDSKAFLEELGRDWLKVASTSNRHEACPALDPNEVLPQDLVAEAESLQDQKCSIPPSILGKIPLNTSKIQKSASSSPAQKPPQDPPDSGFSFDPKTLEDAERIAKGQRPHDP